MSTECNWGPQSDWSQAKQNKWMEMYMEACRTECKLQGCPDLDYTSLVKHMNIIGNWIYYWDQLQRIENTLT